LNLSFLEEALKTTKLSEKYLKELSTDISKKLQEDKDFNAEEKVYAAQVFTKK
jgi:hypothetical protein